MADELDGFARFVADCHWPVALATKARRIAQLRMMRGLSPLTEDEWREWSVTSGHPRKAEQ